MDITFLDTISLPWATRLAHAGAVAIMGVKEFMPMSIFPNSKKTPELMKLVNEVFPIRPEFLSNPIVACQQMSVCGPFSATKASTCSI